MRKPVILVDCDGVMADMHGAWLAAFGRLHGRLPTKEQCTDWSFSKCICTFTEEDIVWRHFASHPGIIENLAEIPGAMAGIERLRSWARVVCVTAPKGGNRLWAGEREAWLMQRGFAKKDIAQCDDKTLIYGDLLLDDGLHNLDDMRKSGLCDWTVSFAQPWNAQKSPHARVNNWDEAVPFIKDLLDGEE